MSNAYNTYLYSYLGSDKIKLSTLVVAVDDQAALGTLDKAACEAARPRLLLPVEVDLRRLRQRVPPYGMRSCLLLICFWRTALQLR